MSFIGKALEALAANLGVSFPDLVLIVTVFACLIIFGLGIRIGLMFSAVVLSVEFVVFYLVGLNSVNILMAMVITYILLALSIFIKPGRGGGAV